MKRLVAVMFGLVLACLAFTPVYADLSGSAVASVYVNVNPNIAVTPAAPIVDAGTVQTGEVSATIPFTIGANLETVSMFVEASNLYKGDDPLSTAVAPIPLNTNKAAELTAQFGNEINAGDNKAIWGAAGTKIGNYDTKVTETVTYESSQNGHFSQNVTVKIYYTQSDPEKTVGQYSGKVRLTAFITP
jgi:hypothetical protein